MKKITVLLLLMFAAAGTLCADGTNNKKGSKSAEEIVLRKVDFSKGKTVLQALKDRRSDREFADKRLDTQTLSELLWAAGGINRESDGGRTAPTAMNSREIDVYAFLEEGVYLYKPQEHKLVLVVEGDKRAAAGRQDYAARAAVNLVYVADLEKMRGNDDGMKIIMCAADSGHVSENVYLYCASADLACVVRASVDEAGLSALLKLKDSQKIILSQSAGYKK